MVGVAGLEYPRALGALRRRPNLPSADVFKSSHQSKRKNRGHHKVTSIFGRSGIIGFHKRED